MIPFSIFYLFGDSKHSKVVTYFDVRKLFVARRELNVTKKKRMVILEILNGLHCSLM